VISVLMRVNALLSDRLFQKRDSDANVDAYRTFQNFVLRDLLARCIARSERVT
jgi:hypothetical protein